MLRRASPLGRIALYASLAACLVISLAALSGAVPRVFVLVPVVALVVVVALGVTVASSGVFARPVISIVTNKPKLALTFDDGPDPRWTPRVLDLLDAAGQRATFFVMGKRAKAHPELVSEIARRGHEVANHSWRHSYATVFLPPKVLTRELEEANGLIENATKIRPKWFRAPVGLLSPRIAPAVALARLELVGWTETARDGTAAQTVEGALARLERALAPGAILVLHDAAMQGDREPIAIRVLPVLLEKLNARGLRSVTLSELARDSESGRSAAALLPNTPRFHAKEPQR